MTVSETSETYDPRSVGHRVLWLLEAAEKAVVISPFITKQGLAPLLRVLGEGAALTLYTRWRADEVAAGMSDTGVLDLIEGRGDVRLHPTLHAKAYICPGRGALVGSANVTRTGLGWQGGGGVELLVEVADEHPAITGLLDLLSVTTSEGTPEVAKQIEGQAEVFENKRKTQEVAGISTVTLGAWIPQYAVPRALWHVYKGERDEKVTELAAPDLAALDPPPGLNESEFRAYVGSVLLQGLSGLMAERLRNLSTYQAIVELTKLANGAGTSLDDPERTWRTLAAWLAYFLPDRYTLGPGGRKLYG